MRTRVRIQPLDNPLPGEQATETVELFDGELTREQVYAKLCSDKLSHRHYANSQNLYNGFKIEYVQ